MLPVSLILLAIIALVLHILFQYLLCPVPLSVLARAGVAAIVILLVLFFWYVLPVHVGG